MKVEASWLTRRAENAPIAEHRKLPSSVALRIRMAWQKVLREAAEGDEVWAFENPANTWKRQGRLTGYAVVRSGKILHSAVVTDTRQ
jgi:hypothetical protein